MSGVGLKMADLIIPGYAELEFDLRVAAGHDRKPLRLGNRVCGVGHQVVRLELEEACE